MILCIRIDLLVLCSPCVVVISNSTGISMLVSRCIVLRLTVARFCVRVLLSGGISLQI